VLVLVLVLVLMLVLVLERKNQLLLDTSRWQVRLRVVRLRTCVAELTHHIEVCQGFLIISVEYRLCATSYQSSHLLRDQPGNVYAIYIHTDRFFLMVRRRTLLNCNFRIETDRHPEAAWQTQSMRSVRHSIDTHCQHGDTVDP